MVDIDELLKQRGEQHGLFEQNATITMLLRITFRERGGWDNLTPVQALALDEIALKIARILSGGHKNTDSWRDIGGYSKLGEPK